ncbi:MAG TPA: hypothetical protein VED46_06165 [Alphaproteobacteria bacterium]|nr:hypothetical protein [Alphaproteobacteria bacterium]
MALRRAAAAVQLRPGELDFRRLPRAELERMAAAGREVALCEAVLGKTADTVVGELLRGQPFFEWDHYPAGEVFDPETGALYYYHAHPQSERDPREHGHFHAFLKSPEPSVEIRPLPVPASDLRAGHDGFAHLIAIAMDAESHPVRLFTTNRWVTGESWHRAKDVLALSHRFAVGHARPSWPANRWITAMLALFRPQLVWLLEERDRALAAWAKGHSGEDATEDRRFEILSSLPIEVAGQRRAIDAALAETARPRPPARS